MNILIPHQWLLEHLKAKVSPQKIQECLSLCGPSIERIDTIQFEPVYDIEVTTNRVDSMSVRGIAREAATILPEFGIPAKLKKIDIPKGFLSKISSQPKLDIKILNDKKLCQQIYAIKMSVGRVGDSPSWLQKRLLQVGQRPLNNLIDITNYVMWEIGHPIHVFDYDRLQEKKIVIRKAVKGETLVTLDNKRHQLHGGEVVFDDSTGTIIDLPGIMGTKNSIVTTHTHNILIWIESVPAPLIRQTSMGLAIRSQAAVLNEKNVDPVLGEDAIHRAIILYTKIAQAQVKSQLFQAYPHPKPPSPIQLSQSRLSTYLGINIPPSRVDKILTALGCEVEVNRQNLLVTPPSFRTHDLQIPEDLIEEIARIYGYHNLPSTLMSTSIPEVPTNMNYYLEHHLKEILTGWGLQEVYTHSMIDKILANQSGFTLAKHLKLKNPLSADWEYLRRSLIPSHLQVARDNPTTFVAIFELAFVYHPQTGKLPRHQLTLTVTIQGSYLHLKGILDALMIKLCVANYLVTPHSNSSHLPFTTSQIGEIKIEKETIGLIGPINQDQTLFAFELNASILLNYAHTHPKVTAVSQTSPIIEDLTFSFPEKTHIGPVINHIHKTSPLVSRIVLKSIFKSNYTFTLFFQHFRTQLSDQEVAPLRKKIVASLQKNFSAQLIGTL